MKPTSRWKCLPLLLALLLSLGAVLATPAAQATPYGEVDIGVFYDALSPYGNWVDHDTYGRVWYPTHVPRGWRPYTDGHWVHTADVGWLWVSDWEWGWAPFHYGRWAWDDWYGWVWVPGRVWAPAWVFWRYGGGYTAWAPMPPTVVWQPGVGVATQYFDWDRDLDRDCWVAVRDRDMAHRYMTRDIVEPWRNRDILHVTNQVNQITYVNNTIFNPGVPVRHIERVSGRPIEPVRIRELDDPFARSRQHSNHRELEIVRPRFRDPDQDEVQRDRARAEQVSRFNSERPRHGDPSRGAFAGQPRQAEGPRIPERFLGKPRPDRRPGDDANRQPGGFGGQDGQRPRQQGQDRGVPTGRVPESQSFQQPEPGRAAQRGPGWQERGQPWRGNNESHQGTQNQPVVPMGSGEGAAPQQRHRFEGGKPPSFQENARQNDMRRGEMTSDPQLRQEQARRQQEQEARQSERQRQQGELEQRRQAEQQQRQEQSWQQQREAEMQRRQGEQFQRQQEQMQQQREAARQADVQQRQQAEMQRRQAEQVQRQQEQMQQQREAARQADVQQRQQAEMQRRQAEQVQRQHEQMQQQREAARQMEMQQRQQAEMQRRQEEQMQRQQERMQQQREMARQAEMQQRQQAEMQRRQAEQFQRQQEQMQQQREAARQMEMQQRQQAEMQRRQAEQFQRQQMQQQYQPAQGHPGGGQRWHNRMD